MPQTPKRGAIRHIGAKRRAPTGFTAAQWEGVRADVRERALFSACVTDGKFLEQIRRVAMAVETGDMAAEDAKAELRDWLERTGYEPEPGEAGTIKDLSSDQRLHIIVDTNTKLAEGYGRRVWQSERLKDWPACELYRAEAREKPRNWALRWRQAGGRLRKGRFVAAFTDPVWTKISRWQHPYPIFDYRSGMWTRMVHRTQAQRLGVPVARVKSQPRERMNTGLQTRATRQFGRDIARAVARNLPGFTLGADGVLRKARAEA
jgi:hypothetical protein